MKDSAQQITMKFCMNGRYFVISSIYARCTAVERLELWDELESTDALGWPWLVGADFNIILNEDEKLGGLQFLQLEVMDFAQCINTCALMDVKFSGSKYTR